jgi:Uma2 family endonuclease
MMAAEKRWYSPEEYLEFDHNSEWKHEYVNGEIYAMSGGSPEHSAICVNITSWLHPRLRGGRCSVYGSDLRVKSEATGLYTYPDATVICGEPRIEAVGRVKSLLNPTLVVEVLSESTEAYDRGAKFEHYRLFDSLQEVVLVAQDRPRVERYTRQGTSSTWLMEEAVSLDDAIRLESLGLEIPLREIYLGIEFPPEQTDRRSPVRKDGKRG